MAKDPAFLFYSNDFLSGTFLMTDEQVGKYIRILCLLHQKNRLTKKDMLNICKTYDVDIFGKFVEQDGVYFNQRMKDETDRRKKYSESRRKNRKGDNICKTYDKDMSNICKTYEKHMETETENITTTNNKSFKKEEVIEYFVGKNYDKEEAEAFFDHYEAQGWLRGNGLPVSNWRVQAENWHRRKLKEEVHGTSKQGSKQGYEFDPAKYEKRKEELKQLFGED